MVYFVGDSESWCGHMMCRGSAEPWHAGKGHYQPFTCPERRAHVSEVRNFKDHKLEGYKTFDLSGDTLQEQEKLRITCLTKPSPNNFLPKTEDGKMKANKLKFLDALFGKLKERENLYVCQRHNLKNEVGG